MTTPTHTDTTINKEDAALPPGTMHGPHHSSLDMTEIAAHDEAQHDAALRDSTLRVPR